MRGKGTGSKRKGTIPESSDGGFDEQEESDEGREGQGSGDRGRGRRGRVNRSSSSFSRDLDGDDNSYMDLDDDTPDSSEGNALNNSTAGSVADYGWGRLPVAYVFCGRLMPDSAAKTCYKSFRKKMDPKGYNWKAVSDDIINDYFIEFKKQYSWPEDQEVVIKAAWTKMASDRYKDFCSKVIKSCVGTTKPPFIMEEDWPGWLTHFNSKKFKELSDTNSKNRKSEVGGPNTGLSNHTCGSKKMLSHMLEMTKENGGVIPPFYKVQRRTHVSRKTGDFIDLRSKQVNEKVVSLVEGGEESLSTMSKEEADRHYVNVVGGVKKQRLYGIGNVGKLFASDSGSADPGSSSSSSLDHILSQMMEIERAQMQEKMEAQLKEKMEIERAQMEAQMNEKLEIERAQMNDKMKENSERMVQFEKDMEQMKLAMKKYFESCSS